MLSHKLETLHVNDFIVQVGVSVMEVSYQN